MKINNEVCIPEPLPEGEILSIWNSAINFVTEKRWSAKEYNDIPCSDKSSIVQETSENILKCYHFATIKETGEIRYYNNGVYRSGGEILIETEAERICEYDLSNKLLAEIRGHIIRKTYISREEFDTDLHVINMHERIIQLVNWRIKTTFSRLLFHKPKTHHL